MITPIELSSKVFNKSGLGYDRKDVDGFMKEVVSSYESLYKENVELTAQRVVLAKMTRITIKNGLKLIGVEALEKM